MATLETRLRKLEAAARDNEDTASLFIIAADEAEAEQRIAELGVAREDVTIIITGVHRAPKGPAQ